MTEKYKTKYVAEVSIVAHEFWVAIFKDKKGSQHIRQITKTDAWKYDVQVGLFVELELRPYNSCKILKVVSRPL